MSFLQTFSYALTEAIVHVYKTLNVFSGANLAYPLQEQHAVLQQAIPASHG